jgi:hypothetical protein
LVLDLEVDGSVARIPGADTLTRDRPLLAAASLNAAVRYEQ